VTVDKFGNLIAHKKGSGPTVMLVAHMDEVGLMIKSINERGNIFCSEIGGLEPVSLIGRLVSIKTNKNQIYGVISTPEINDDEEVTALPKIDDLFVYTGLNKKELMSQGVEIGSFIELVRETVFLGNKNMICGKALDDRVGCCILVELAKRLKKSKDDIYFVFTVQEEIGLYGSKTSIEAINPSWAIVVDVTNADDSHEHTHEVTKEVGLGPCVTVKDADMIANVCIDGWLKDIAKKNKIPIQLEVSDIGTTDALSISISKGGIPTAVVGVAVRNLHTTSGVASLKDIENTIRLLTELIKNHPATCIV
jgi:endoglucanase